MQTISATYRVTTPMFLGGASEPETEELRRIGFAPDHPAELRLPSFKGALRFWWRALAWDRCKEPQRLHHEEDTLFGSSDEHVGQSSVLMRLRPHSVSVLHPNLDDKTQLKDGNQIVGEGSRYLGYGVMEAFKRKIRNQNREVIYETAPAQITRSCLLAPFEFTVVLLPKQTVTERQRQQLLQALKALGLLGGLGSKSRKGYGSLTLTSLTEEDRATGESKKLWMPPRNPSDFCQRLQELLGSNQLRAGDTGNSVFNDLPDWTAFSPAARVLVVPAADQDRTPLALLDRVGREMLRYRSWGRNGKVLGKERREEIFKSDHDLMVIQHHPRRAHPERIVFGLPHNYGKKKHHKEVKPKNFDRRASPLFIHIHKASESDLPIAVLTFLPSQFLPENQSRISVGGNPVELHSSDLWEPIENWLKRVKGETPKPHERKEPFGEVVEVTHG